MFGKSKEEKVEEKQLKEELLRKEIMDSIKLALSGLLTESHNMDKLLEKGGKASIHFTKDEVDTYAIVLNTTIQLRILEQLEEINKNLEHLSL